MPKRAVTALSEIKIKGKKFWRLTYRTADGRKREHFADKKAADKRLGEVLEDARRHGTEAQIISSELRASAVAAQRLLEGTGRTILDAARFLAEHLERVKNGVSVEDAVEKFLRSRDDRSEGYRKTLKARMGNFAAFFAGRKVGELTPADCQKFLDGLSGAPRTRAHYRTHLAVFFTYARHRGWCLEDPVTATAPVRVTGGDVGILTPAESERLLISCAQEILPGVCLSMFCGLRLAELARLDWEAVDLAQRHVVIGAGIAKTNSRRVVVIPTNAVRWLRPHVLKSGKVWPQGELSRDPWTIARIKAGFGPLFETSAEAKKLQTDPKTGERKASLKPWPHNALRHSAISYRVAQDRDLAKVGYEMGTSPAMIQRHYNGLATPQAAKAFFAIVPNPSAQRTLGA